jgi:hypothetical protein
VDEESEGDGLDASVKRPEITSNKVNDLKDLEGISPSIMRNTPRYHLMGAGGSRET